MPVRVKTKKVVVNKCYGGFSISPEACLWLLDNGFKEKGFLTPVKKYYGNMERAKTDLENWKAYQAGPKDRRRDSLFITVFTPDEKHVIGQGREIQRDHPLLIKCVETLGEKANGSCAKLKIVEIPADVDYEVEEYDGQEWIAEKHRTW